MAEYTGKTGGAGTDKESQTTDTQQAKCEKIKEWGWWLRNFDS